MCLIVHLKKNRQQGSEEMTRRVKRLPCQCEGLSADPQNAYEKQAKTGPVIPAGEVETGGFLAALVNSRPETDPSQRK